MAIVEGYEPRFDIDLGRGKVGEHLVDVALADLSASHIEVKTDYQAHKTGNLYIETHQFSSPDRSDKRPSGINTTEAQYWAFSSPSDPMFLVVKTDLLREFISDEFRTTKTSQPIANGKTNGSEGYLIEVAQLLSFGKLGKDPYPKMY